MQTECGTTGDGMNRPMPKCVPGNHRYVSPPDAGLQFGRPSRSTMRQSFHSNKSLVRATTAFLIGWAISVAVLGNSSEQILISGVVLDYIGKPLTNITVHAFMEDAQSRSARTDLQGHFAIGACSATWSVQVDEQELLARGFFCLPGDQWLPEQTNTLLFFALPTRPTLAISVSAQGESKLQLTFDVPSIAQTVFRTYSIEATEDFATWVSLVSTTLVSSPIEIIDPAATQHSLRFYRAVLLEPNLPPVVVIP